MIRRLLGEFLGAFFLVFAGCGAIVVNSTAGGALGHVGVAVTFGLVVMVLVLALGDVSGAHLNPAVSLAFVAAGRFGARQAGAYALVQCLGAIGAAALLRALFPESETLGQTLPLGPPWRSFVLEFILTFALMLVILSVSSGPKEKGTMAGVAIGGLVGLEAMFAGPICGASMNPARSLGPALVAGQLEHLWIYLAAPTLGALAAVPCWAAIRPGSRLP